MPLFGAAPLAPARTRGRGRAGLGFQVVLIRGRLNEVTMGGPGCTGEVGEAKQGGLSPPLIASRPCELVSPRNEVRYRAGIPESAAGGRARDARTLRGSGALGSIYSFKDESLLPSSPDGEPWRRQRERRRG